MRVTKVVVVRQETCHIVHEIQLHVGNSGFW